MISLIIPVLNEEDILKRNFSHFEELKKDAELIFVDGESSVHLTWLELLWI